MIENSLPNALDIGLSEEEFYNLTLGEFLRRMESYNRVFLQNLKLQASMDYTQAELFGCYIAAIFGGESDIPPLKEAYRFLYSEEEIEREKAEKEAKLYEARFMEWASNHNLKRSLQGGENINDR